MSIIKEYPLQWPVGYPRTDQRKTALFKTSFSFARYMAKDELRKLGATEIIINSNVQILANGSVANENTRRANEDGGVAVYFNLNNVPRVICCDKWDSVRDNMQAIAKSIEAIRGLDRWGVSDMLNRVFTGFEALPAKDTWYQVLGVEETATEDTVKTAYRTLVNQYHPDKPTGNRVQFERVVEAYREYQSI